MNEGDPRRRFVIRRAPEIQTVVGTAGLVAMGYAGIDPESAIEASRRSPVGLAALVEAAAQIGVSQEGAILGLTFIFGVITADGITKVMARRNRQL